MHDHHSAAGYTALGLRWLVRLDYLEWIKFTGIDNRQVSLTASVDPTLSLNAPSHWGCGRSGHTIFSPKT